MDYRRFLGRAEERVLPYLGSDWVDAPDRRLRISGAPPASPGWYRFQIQGRSATAGEAAEAPDLSALPAVRGHLLGTRLVSQGAVAEDVYLLPPEEPPRFAPARARRWSSGELLFEALELETEAEESVRRAYEESTGLTGVSGAPATLRAAFAYAVLGDVSRRLAIPFAQAELRARVGDVADGGPAAAERLLRALAEEREQARREMAELERARRAAAAAEELRRARDEQRRRAERAREHVQDRAREALAGSGALLRGLRDLGDGHVEVTFAFMGERFVAVVDSATLQVVDSGICLGHPPRDELLTLDSLPSVIREAIDTGALVILRHA